MRALLPLLLLGVAVAAPSPTTVGAFEVHPQTNAAGADRSWLTTDGTRLFLHWECESDGLNVVLDTTDGYFDDEDFHVVTVQFGQDKPTDIDDWEASTDNEALYMPMDTVTTFTLQALHSPKVTITVQDSWGETFTDTFDLSGLGRALTNLPCTRSSR